MRISLLLFLLLGCRGPTGSVLVGEEPADTGAIPDSGGSTGDTGAVSGDVPGLRDEQPGPGPVTFTELLYSPLGDGELEWLELHNPMVFDMDLSGWALDDGVAFSFPEGTIMPAGGYLVVARDPELLESETGFAEALGPYDGRLSNSGERVTLTSNSGRLIDTVAYGEDDPWPVLADGSGVSLAKIAPTAASDHAESWTVSDQLGGSPGESNQLDPLALPVVETLVAADAAWRYDISGDYPSADWAEPGHDDSGWESGAAPFFSGTAEDTTATAWVTADNYFALYLGSSDGSDLRWVGADSDGSWTTVEEIDLDLTAADHLYLAAWELTGDSTTQMVIAEVEWGDGLIGTDAAGFEWVLGLPGDGPGALPDSAPPSAAAITAIVDDANDDAAWALPAVEAASTSSPWGSSVSGAFTGTGQFIWGDTFDGSSQTNSDDTYALYRSVDPVLGARGTTELDWLPTTSTFRTGFTFLGSPDQTALYLSCTLDDGAVFFLNGVEVHRENMPTGPVDASTLASTATSGAADVFAELSTASLVKGDNVLAVEVHQSSADDADMIFGCELTAETWADTAVPSLVLNEVGPVDEPMWAEIRNVHPGSVSLSGVVLAASGGGEVALPDETLKPGERLLLDGLSLSPDDRLFLYDADGELLDGVRVGEVPRARLENGGPWRVPGEATPGEENVFELSEDVVINEIQYHRSPLSEEGQPVTSRDEEWIELYNRGEDTVDLSGWQLSDAVGFSFPDGTALEPGGYLVIASDAEALRDDHPGIAVLGDLDGRLDNSTDRILLLDAVGNPADSVRYFDGGRWPSAADGGGSSLELGDPWADNAAPEAWAASDESGRSEWTQVSIRGVAEPSALGPDGVWEELVLGLLDAGEVLIDDLSVVQDPDTNPVEILSNGDFDDDEGWRLLGTHRHSGIIADPDDAGESVLRLVATDSTGHMHNHAETTLLRNISEREYEISFRARWISGSNQLNSRLYFNRLAQTTRISQPSISGTPGAENSTASSNLGPTFSDLRQDVAVPRPGEPVVISVSVSDPDGVAAVSLFTSVDGAAPQPQAMSEGEPGEWSAEVEGQAAGSIIQLYVEAEDDLGAATSFPAAGADSRALFTVSDDDDATNGLHTFRILMTEEDADWLHEDVNLMSNDRVGATVVYNESEVFYDVGVRLKGSQRGRPTDSRLGYGVRFRDDQPFRGSHTSVLIDRSEGVGFGQREVLLNLAMTRAGLVSGEHNDLIKLIAPRSSYTGAAELQLDRFSNLVLDAQFSDGASGTRFEYELIYYPTTTDDGTDEGLKLPQPDTVQGTPITDMGDDAEDYRWNFLIKNNLREDRYDEIMALGKTFALSDGVFLVQVGDVIDVEQWLRAFAFSTLSGATDQYGGVGTQHNAQLYVRPDDGRVLFFPHDLDYFSSASMAVVGNSDLSRLLADPVNRRSYYGHLNDIISRAYTTDYLGPWCDQLGELLSDQDFDAHCDFVDDRADWVLSSSPESVLSQFPAVDFRITTGGGGSVSTGGSEITLEGEAWVDVRGISLDGAPLSVTWTDERTWQVTVPLQDGENELTLTATDLHGAAVGSDTITVTVKGG